jgi:nucleoside-diphosphate-sugar epimerase
MRRSIALPRLDRATAAGATGRPARACAGQDRTGRHCALEAARGAKAAEVLDWRPTIPLRQGLGRTIAYFETLLSKSPVEA